MAKVMMQAELYVNRNFFHIKEIYDYLRIEERYVACNNDCNYKYQTKNYYIIDRDGVECPIEEEYCLEVPDDFVVDATDPIDAFIDRYDSIDQKGTKIKDFKLAYKEYLGIDIEQTLRDEKGFDTGYKNPGAKRTI